MATQLAEDKSILGLENPMGTDGFEFVEYTAPDTTLLRDLFTKMGFPAVAKFIEETIEQGTEHGYVSTLFGRRRQVPELRARRWELRKQGERFAVNMVIQGTAADIMKVAMVRADRALAEAGLESKLVLQIHDELLFEGPESEAEQVRQIAVTEMEAAYPLDPPLAVEAGIGTDWLSAK